jgi:ubiquinone/menaquinone biosynthesis C-methylase UbiE
MLSLDQQNAYRARLGALQPNWRPATEVYEATIRRYLRPNTQLLDVGCGRGGVLEQLATREYRMMGVDPDTRSLVEHRLSVQTVPRAAGLMGQLPFRSASFDLVISSWVLEHLPRPAVAFAEAARVLRPGGHMITLAPNGWHPVTALNRLLAWARPLQARLVPRLYGRSEEDAFPVHYRANSVRHLRQLGRTAGLVPITVQTISDPTYLAFNETLFQLSRGLERLLPARAWVHIVADFVRP